MYRRLVVTGILALLQVLWMLVGIVSGTQSTDVEAYIAAQGQTIAEIAQEYGIPAEYLAQMNKIPANQPLRGGQMIVIPGLPDADETDLNQARNGEAQTSAGNTVQGKLAVVTAEKAQILDQPGAGKTLFNNAPRGTQLLALGELGDYYAVLMSDGSTGFILKKAVGLTERYLTVPRPTPPPPPEVSKRGYTPVVETAFTYLGLPYRYGGRLPNSVDCSLLVQAVFRQHGMRLPRTAAQQFAVGDTVGTQDMQAGDRIYFYNRARTRIGHTGIYIGDGRFIHASANRGKVAVDELSNPTYWSIYAGARR